MLCLARPTATHSSPHQFASNDKVYFKNPKMRELDEVLGDIQSEIIGEAFV
jgi:hypothetical protein